MNEALKQEIDSIFYEDRVNDDECVDDVEPIINDKPMCPYCGLVHSTDYIPVDCGDGDEYYIECEAAKCREVFAVDVQFGSEAIEMSPDATYEDCVLTHNIMFWNYRLDDRNPTIESPY